MELRERLVRVYDSRAIFYHWPTVHKVLNGDSPVPICMDIDLANMCNHNCVWCHSKEVRKSRPLVMPRQLVETILRCLAELGCKSVIFSGGGEPLTNPSITRALRLAGELRLKVALITNGGLLSKEIAEVAAETCSWVRISLDAGSSATHQRLHRPKKGTYEEVMSSLYHLGTVRRRSRRENFSIGVGFLIHPFNVTEIYCAARQVRDAGADYIFFRPAVMQGASLDPLLPQIAQEQERAARELNSEQFVVLGARIESIRTALVRKPKDYAICLGYQLAGVIGATGDVYLCCLYRQPQWSFGRLQQKKLDELTAEEFWTPVWLGQRRKEVVDRLDVRNCPPCKQDRYNGLLWRLYQDPEERENIHRLMEFCSGGAEVDLEGIKSWLDGLTRTAPRTVDLAKWILDYFNELGLPLPSTGDEVFFL